MISTQLVPGVDHERKAYIMYQTSDNINKCIGSFTEQCNDSDEVQYIFEIYQDKLSDRERACITIPGIDITTGERIHVRSYGLPYFLERCTPRKTREDTPEYLQSLQLDYIDPFECTVRSRAITHHSDCYVGRFPTDFIDFKRAQKDFTYYKSIIPNLDEQPENVYHKIDNEVIV